MERSCWKRGVNDVGSFSLEYVKRNHRILGEGRERCLVVWSDRCKGQINNWPIPCLLQYLRHQNYFTSVIQRFLTSGHTFLPCDRLVALIQKHRMNESKCDSSRRLEHRHPQYASPRTFADDVYDSRAFLRYQIYRTSNATP
jgi:hypothetical protein